MTSFIRSVVAYVAVFRDILIFLWRRKLWWLIPLVFVLLVFGLLLAFASATGIAPFIYTIF